MTSYIIDSFAVLKLIKKEEGYQKIAKIIQKANQNQVKLLISNINFGEILYRLTLIKGQEYFEKIEQIIRALPIKIVEIETNDIINSAKLKSRGGISYADCFTITLAQKTEAMILTGDKEFEKFQEEVVIEWV